MTPRGRIVLQLVALVVSLIALVSSLAARELHPDDAWLLHGLTNNMRAAWVTNSIGPKVIVFTQDDVDAAYARGVNDALRSLVPVINSLSPADKTELTWSQVIREVRKELLGTGTGDKEEKEKKKP